MMAIPTVEIIGLEGESREMRSARQQIGALAGKLEGLRAVHVLFRRKEDNSAEITVFTNWPPKEEAILKAVRGHFGITETNSHRVDKLGGLSGLRPNEVTRENTGRIKDVQTRNATHMFYFCVPNQESRK